MRGKAGDVNSNESTRIAQKHVLVVTPRGKEESGPEALNRSLHCPPKSWVE